MPEDLTPLPKETAQFDPSQMVEDFITALDAIKDGDVLPPIGQRDCSLKLGDGRIVYISDQASSNHEMWPKGTRNAGELPDRKGGILEIERAIFIGVTTKSHSPTSTPDDRVEYYLFGNPTSYKNSIMGKALAATVHKNPDNPFPNTPTIYVEDGAANFAVVQAESPHIPTLSEALSKLSSVATPPVAG